MVGYKVQTAVETKNHIIVTHEVTNAGHDRSALNNTAVSTKEVIGMDTRRCGWQGLLQWHRDPRL